MIRERLLSPGMIISVLCYMTWLQHQLPMRMLGRSYEKSRSPQPMNCAAWPHIVKTDAALNIMECLRSDSY